jgi:thioredoxin 1
MENLTKDNFNQKVNDSKGLLIVDFWATWCGPCKQMAPILEKAAENFSGQASIAKLNIDEETDIAAEYGIRSIPTFIAFKDGKQIDTKIGGMRLSQFEEWIQTLID